MTDFPLTCLWKNLKYCIEGLQDSLFLAAGSMILLHTTSLFLIHVVNLIDVAVNLPLGWKGSPEASQCRITKPILYLYHPSLSRNMQSGLYK